jgi:hypothetical protein
VLLLIPIILFLLSLYIPPTIVSDSAAGFLALRNMLGGGAFNSITTPDPANICNDVVTFLTWWSPGQYLVPGSFILLGTSYGLALSLTTLIATLIGVAGRAGGTTTRLNRIQAARIRGVRACIRCVPIAPPATLTQGQP